MFCSHKYIPVYNSLSPAITQAEAEQEEKWHLDLKCLKTGEGGQITEEKPPENGIRPPLIQA